ncbi:beta-lactamase family protein [Vibrio sp. S4M6]|uniref:serine hydrolase domain-containing protein n=1 Tax=Vibrio sinus TaxID=2946865 RepID=UPI00202A8C15|nr:serine hydrolase domain-containing protein [Vibrio sinus]MCL9781764.1 beta-lactamase family protein [Vibrio sinus]
MNIVKTITRLSVVALLLCSANTLSMELSPQTKEKIQGALESYRVANNITGAQLSVSLPSYEHSDSIATFYSGYTTTENLTPIGSLLESSNEKVDLLSIGSITKSFITAVILQLDKEKKLSTNDKLSQYFPDYPDWGNVTIKELLNMTSGIAPYMDTTQYESAPPTTQWTKRKLVDLAYNNIQPNRCSNVGGNTCFTPGTSWFYSNTNTNLAGLIIEKVTGKTLKQELELRLLGKHSKLHALSSTFFVPDGDSAKIYKRMVHEYDENDRITDYTSFNLSWARAGGAMVSNSRDLVRWGRLLFNTNKVIPKSEFNDFTMLHCIDENSTRYTKPINRVSAQCNIGFGLNIMQMRMPDGNVVWGYEGDWPGIQAQFWYLPNTDIVVSLQQDTGKHGELPADIMTLFKQIYKYLN